MLNTPRFTPKTYLCEWFRRYFNFKRSITGILQLRLQRNGTDVAFGGLRCNTQRPKRAKLKIQTNSKTFIRRIVTFEDVLEVIQPAKGHNKMSHRFADSISKIYSRVPVPKWNSAIIFEQTMPSYQWSQQSERSQKQWTRPKEHINISIRAEMHLFSALVSAGLSAFDDIGLPFLSAGNTLKWVLVPSRAWTRPGPSALVVAGSAAKIQYSAHNEHHECHDPYRSFGRDTRRRHWRIMSTQHSTSSRSNFAYTYRYYPTHNQSKRHLMRREHHSYLCQKTI